MPEQMQAIAIDRFGGTDVLRVQTIPVPKLGADEVLIRVEWAGVGEWDPFEREGGYAQMMGIEPDFPYVLGSEGAGTVAAVGEEADVFQEGDRVYAGAFLNPKGGFYAEYVAVPSGLVKPIPESLTTQQTAVMSGVALTALRGLEDVLAIKGGETILIFGASGGVGHMAVQLAKAKGARVLAVASGDDGVALAKRIGADAVVNGRTDDVLAAAREFAPEGLAAALLTAGGEAANRALTAMRPNGRIAFPNGVQPEPVAAEGVQRTGYNADPDAELLTRLHRFVSANKFEVHVDRTFALADVADAHRALEAHHIGKLALRVTA